MMTAEEANKKSHENEITTVQNEVDEVMRAIHYAVGRGDFRVVWENDLRNKTKAKLRELGYVVGIRADRDKEVSIISW